MAAQKPNATDRRSGRWTRTVAAALLLWPLALPVAARAQTAAPAMRVLVTASHEAVISGEIEARIVAIGPGDGEAFAKDDVLIRFDCTLPGSALTEAQAELTAAQASLGTKTKLDRLGSVSGLDVQLARAAVEKATAAVQSARWRVRQCVIKAPYDGRVVKRLANAHEVASQGQKLIEIVSARDLEVRVIVPSTWSARIKAGDVFQFTLEETGRTYGARVVAMGARIDPASQSIEIRGRISQPASEIVIGMSGLARFGTGQ